MDVTITGLPSDTDDNNYTYLLWVCWRDYSFDIRVVHKNQSWQGNVSRENLEQLSQLLSLPTEDYLNETKTALTTHGGTSRFSYHIIDNQFIWKKVVKNNIKIKFGSVSLEEANFQDTISKIIEDLLTKNLVYKLEVENLQKENSQAAEDKAELMNKLVEYKKQKQEMENKLFSQFLTVLNRKKQVMQCKTEEDNHNNGTSSAQESTNHYYSDTEVEDDTDNEQNDEIPRNNSVEWFEDEPEPKACLPKRIPRKKRISEQDTEKPGPSQKKPLKLVPPSESKNSQDLWDDF